MDNSPTTNTQENGSNVESGRTTVCLGLNLLYYINLNSALRVAIQFRIKNQESEQKELGQSRHQIMTMESTRVPHLNHVPLVVGILLQLLTMLSLLRALQTTLFVLLPSKLDEGIRLSLLRRIPMLLLPRTSLWRKVLDDLALGPNLPSPNPPNQQLFIHLEEKEEKLLLARKEMTWYLSWFVDWLRRPITIVPSVSPPYVLTKPFGHARLQPLSSRMDKMSHLNIVGHPSTSNVFIRGQIKAWKRSQRLGGLEVSLIERAIGVVQVVKLSEILFLLDIGTVIFYFYYWHTCSDA